MTDFARIAGYGEIEVRVMDFAPDSGVIIPCPTWSDLMVERLMLVISPRGWAELQSLEGHRELLEELRLRRVERDRWADDGGACV